MESMLISLLIFFIVVAIIAYGIQLLVPEPFKRFGLLIVGGVVLIYLIKLLFDFV